MNKQKDFNTQSDKYVDIRKSYGVNDPYALKEIGEAHYQCAEYGYQYAIEKACEWLENNAYLYVNDIDQINESALIGDFRGVMED